MAPKDRAGTHVHGLSGSWISLHTKVTSSRKVKCHVDTELTWQVRLAASIGESMTNTN